MMKMRIYSCAALVALAVVGCEEPGDYTTPNAASPTSTDALPVDPITVDPVAVDPAANVPATNNPKTGDSAARVEQSTSAVAICELVPVGDSKVRGAVRFTQEGDVVKVRGEVTGLTPGKHGFHVHEKGDLSDKETGKSTGGHFNPTDQPHGKMTDEKRHVGDLGNIEANEEGIAMIKIDDSVISLKGEHSIVGRAIVIHAEADQFTQPTGDAGARVAFGKIENASAE
ncbi:superoxide dismutase family protein [Rosistilla oblonga]|nr:superoxide dismutase family protein [Rosistilla oblonga]